VTPGDRRIDAAGNTTVRTSSPTKIEMIFDYHDFGVPVTIDEPPADQAKNIGEVLGKPSATGRATLPAGVC